MEFMQDLARGAGRIQKDKFQKISHWRAKSGRGDIVTEVDYECERYILDRLREECPDATIMSEESGASGVPGGESVWIIDPLDGTRNYATGIPFFAVSIGVAVNGAAEAGVVYDAIHDEMFSAERGKGAYLNGEPISVSEDASLDDAVISVAWVQTKADRRQFMKFIEEMSRDTAYFRRLGSAALIMAYVACGRIAGYIQGGLSPWDVAGGAILIPEAGGVMTDFHGSPIDLRKPNLEVAAANPTIHAIFTDRVLPKGRK